MNFFSYTNKEGEKLGIIFGVFWCGIMNIHNNKHVSRTWNTTKTKAQKEMSMFNFQTWNKTRLHDSKIKTQELRIRTRDVWDKCENGSLYANMKLRSMTKLWFKIVLKIGVEQIKRNEDFYFYLYLFKDLAQRSFQGCFYVCIK